MSTLQGLGVTNALDQWHVRHTLPTLLPTPRTPLEALLFGNDLWIALGDKGLLLKTPDPIGSPWVDQQMPTTQDLNDGIYVNGEFWIVGGGGTILSSTNGTDWIQRNSGTTDSLNSITYGAGRYVAARSQGILTSTNGIQWSNATTESLNIVSVAYGNGRFVAAPAFNNMVLVSTDGLTWTQASLPNPTGMLRVQFVDGLFVLIGSGGRLLTSSDGLEWTERQVTYSSTAVSAVNQPFFYDVSHIDGRFVAVGGSIFFPSAQSIIVVSDDGIAWREIDTNKQSPLTAIAVGAGKLVAVGGGYSGPARFEDMVLTSTNGLNWLRADRPPNLNAVIYARDQFLSVGENGLAMSSADGVAWASRSTGISVELNDVIFDGQQFIAVGDNGTILTSPDSTNWMQRSTQTILPLEGIAIGNGIRVAVGGRQTFFGFGSTSAERIILSSTNGIDWHAYPSGIYASTLNDTAFGNGLFVAVGGIYGSLSPDSRMIITSTNGTVWVENTQTIGSVLHGVAYGNGLFTAVADFGAILFSTDGRNWNDSIPMQTGVPNWRTVSFGAGTFTVLGSNGAMRTSTSPATTNWVTRQTGTTNALNDIAFGKGTFIAVGANAIILQSGTLNESTPPVIAVHPTNRIATVGATTQFHVSAISSSPTTYQWQFNGIDIPGATNALYEIEAVQFTDAGLYQAIVRNESGSTSSESAQLSVAPLKTGQFDLSLNAGLSSYKFPNPSVSTGFASAYAAVSQPDGRILVGGNFDNPIPGLVRLTKNGEIDPDFQIGSGINGIVATIALQADGKILIGGDFTTINGKSRNFLARLNPNGQVDPSFNIGSGIAEGGFVLDAGTQGPRSKVSTIVLQPDGKILVAGSFTRFNGNDVSNIIRLHSDGSLDASFRTSAGPNATIRALAIQSDGKILIGGDFTQVQNDSRWALARLTVNGELDTTFKRGENLLGPINTLAIDVDGRIVAGGRTENSAPNAPGFGFVQRFLQDGTLDANFSTEFPDLLNVHDVAIQPDGRILVGSIGFLTRLLENGRTDRSFTSALEIKGGAEWVLPRFGGRTYDSVRSIQIDSNGTALIAGSFTQLSEYARNYVARIALSDNTVPLLSPRITNGSFEFAVPTVPGSRYFIEASDSLSLTSKSWEKFSEMQGDGSVKVIRDPSFPKTTRFYRIRDGQE